MTGRALPETVPDTVIVTGAGGFVGQNLIRRLHGRVNRLIAVGRTAALPGLPDGVASLALADIDRLDPGDDAVLVHLAAPRYDAGNFRTGQSRLLVDNVDLAGRIYDFCAAKAVREVRLASSIAVYDAGAIVLDDQQPLSAADPFASELMYGWSKRIGETYARLYRDKYGIETVAFRLSNPYGPFDALDEAAAHVVPAFVIRALTGSGPFTVRGNPAATRDFIYIDDAVDIFVRSLAWRGRSAVFNLATGQNTAIATLAETILRLCGSDRPISVQGTGTGDVVHRRCRIEALRAAFPAAAVTGLEPGLATTIDWYRHVLGV